MGESRLEACDLKIPYYAEYIFGHIAHLGGLILTFVLKHLLINGRLESSMH